MRALALALIGFGGAPAARADIYNPGPWIVFPGARGELTHEARDILDTTIVAAARLPGTMLVICNEGRRSSAARERRMRRDVRRALIRHGLDRRRVASETCDIVRDEARPPAVIVMLGPR